MTTDDGTPERALLLAILREAIETYCSRPRNEKQRHWRNNAERWFAEDYKHGDTGFTFSEVCEYLRLDESYMRRLIRARAEAANKQDKNNYRVLLLKQRGRRTSVR